MKNPQRLVVSELRRLPCCWVNVMLLHWRGSMYILTDAKCNIHLIILKDTGSQF